MPSIRWIKALKVDGKEVNIEIMLGANNISDKCYVRINQDVEYYFKPEDDSRYGVINKGLEFVRNHFNGKKVQYPNGKDYDWK